MKASNPQANMTPNDPTVLAKIIATLILEVLLLAGSWTFLLDVSQKIIMLVISILLFIYARKKFIQDSVNGKLEEEIKRRTLAKLPNPPEDGKPL